MGQRDPFGCQTKVPSQGLVIPGTSTQNQKSLSRVRSLEVRHLGRQNHQALVMAAEAATQASQRYVRVPLRRRAHLKPAWVAAFAAMTERVQGTCDSGY